MSVFLPLSFSRYPEILPRITFQESNFTIITFRMHGGAPGDARSLMQVQFQFPSTPRTMQLIGTSPTVPSELPLPLNRRHTGRLFRALSVTPETAKPLIPL